MNHKQNIFYLLAGLMLFGFLSSCTKDETPPQIIDVTPSENTPLLNGQEYVFSVEVTDDEALESYKLTYQFDGIFAEGQRSGSLSGTHDSFSETITTPQSFEYMDLSLSISDACENVSNSQIRYFAPTSGNLNLNFRLRYGDLPLVMLNEYDYPDGKKMNFSRFSMYVSEVTLHSGSNTSILSEVDFLNLTNQHLSISDAEAGRDFILNQVDPKSYDALSFKIGVIPAQNALAPSDFPSGHPLANPAEHWFSWDSYIFTKVEGNIDFNNDGSLESPIALHMGSNAALREIVISRPIIIQINKTEKITINIDLLKLFEGSNGIYDIESNPQIHSLSQLDQVIELSNNLETIFN